MNLLTVGRFTKNVILQLMNLQKLFVAIFFLLALLSKVSAFHTYMHTDDHVHVDDCELCEYALYNQSVDFSYNSELSLLVDTIPLSAYLLETPYKTDDTSASAIIIHCSRPPPMTNKSV